MRSSGGADHRGPGTWRQLAPGTRFGLSQHAVVAADAAFLCLQVRHQARNNLGAEVFDALEHRWARWRWPARRCRQRWRA
uniref:hypothetical protein n=1 Tax=Xanthomonas oryzae TaxID=347 RepID=UPI003DA094D9